MPNAILLEPIEGDDGPCGPNLQWNPEFIQLSQDFEAAKTGGGESTVLDGEAVTSDPPTFEEVLEQAEILCKQTKDIRVLIVYAEACWFEHGLSGFADAMTDLMVVIETWASPEDGIWPRADEDDGDLGERAAPLGKLISRIPILTNTLGWGEEQVEISERLRVTAQLKEVFDVWSSRLEPALGTEGASIVSGWKTLQTILGDDSVAGGVDEDGEKTGLPGGDAWDLIERAAELMANQDRHSPALPVLRLLATWRSLDIIEISLDMKTSGVALEQMLESINRQLTGGN